MEPSANEDIANQVAFIIAFTATTGLLVGLVAAFLLLRLLAIIRRRSNKPLGIRAEVGQKESGVD